LQKRRDHLTIITSILSIARNGATKTRIVYRANLNFERATRYMAYLIEKGLLEQQTGSSGSPIYRTSDKGIQFLKDVKRILELV